MTMIRYKKSNIHALPYTPSQKEGMPVALAPAEIHSLKPGWNEFPSHVWAQHENHPDIKKMLDDGHIELMNETVEEKGPKGKVVKKQIGIDDKEISLKEVPDSKAIQICNETFNPGMLQRWLDEETRSKVKRALEAQLKKVSSDKPKEQD